MKVLKEANATTGAIGDAETRYNEADKAKDRLAILDEFLEDQADIPEDIVRKLNSLGYVFLNNWIKAMRWDELGRHTNEFAEILRRANTNDPFLRSEDNFTKLYNSYAHENIEQRYLNPSSDYGKVFTALYKDPRLYQENDLKNFIEIISLFDKLANSNTTPSQLKYIFFEVQNGEVTDISTFARIKEKVNKISPNSNNAKKILGNDFKEIVDTAVKDPQMRQYMADKLKEN